MQEMSRMIVRSLGVGRCLNWKVLNSRGVSGGVLVFWDKRVLQLLEAEMRTFSVSCRFKSCEDDFCWHFSWVYGPTLKKKMVDFLAELGAVRGLWGRPWCVAGDFNMVRFPVESSRRGRLTSSMRRFLEIIEDLELRDLPLHGGFFTWNGGLNNQSHSRIDQFLVSNEWEGHFSKAVQSVLPKSISDHFPILLDGGGVRGGPMPFRFENMWLKKEGFKENVQTWWVGLNFSGSTSFVLATKLKTLKSLLRDWNRLEFGKVEVNKAMALNQVDFLGQSRINPTSFCSRGGCKEWSKKGF
ncbi:hypothetical protein VitviT2T_019813 [Vitis vinifera]|uniref:Endonuclease/exonuclease/phosphatase domain-containing protein n=1 Tax=Vitis vinifera TaxID=29760 RepID=A0ABY9D1W4_VITVI|nr:hypothetical protein VitviT2T_019813 [Vitis vinifera]